MKVKRSKQFVECFITRLLKFKNFGLIFYVFSVILKKLIVLTTNSGTVVNEADGKFSASC